VESIKKRLFFSVVCIYCNIPFLYGTGSRHRDKGVVEVLAVALEPIYVYDVHTVYISDGDPSNHAHAYKLYIILY
jgi:hypothetical protein